MRRELLLVLCVLPWAGCGDDDAMTVDAAASSDATAGIGPVLPWLEEGAPPVAPPGFVCPPGWREIAGADDETPTCDPFPESGASDCPPGEAHFPGAPGCAPVGAACPAGDFPDDLPSDAPVTHVLEGATSGDGSATAPYGALSEFSLAGLPAGTTLALGPGTYDFPLRLRSNFTVRGACAARTTLTATSPPEMEAVVQPTGTGVVVRDLTIGPSARVGILVPAGAAIELDGVVLAENHGAGLLALGGDVTATRLVVRDTRILSSGEFGRGLLVQSGGNVSVDTAVIDGNRDFGVYANSDGTTVELRQVVIRDTVSRFGVRTFGHGAQVESGSSVAIRAGVLERNHAYAVHALGGAVELEDVVLRETLVQESDGTQGFGMQAQSGAVVRAVRMLVDGNTDLGMIAGDSDTVLEMTDLVVRDTLPDSIGRFGRGIDLQGGVGVTLTRAAFERNLDVGVMLVGPGTSLTATDLIVRDTGVQEIDGNGGRGVSAQVDATASIERAILERNHGIGVYVSGSAATAELTDLLVRGTESRADGTGGRGLEVARGADVTVRRALLEGNREVSVTTGVTGTRTVLEDLVVTGTVERACAADTCMGLGGGFGVIAVEGASTTVRRFAVRDSALCGVLVALDGELDLSDGIVSGGAIGACVQVSSYDVERLAMNVAYTDNGVNIDSTELPVPSVSTPLPDGS